MSVAPLPFSDAQVATLRAALDRIIPPDDFPGAWAAGVGDYLSRQFMGDLASLVPAYIAGLDSLAAVALATTGRDFAMMAVGGQDYLLAAIEAGEHGAALAAFFATLVAHTMEGYYGDPGNGGNRDGVAWAMIGFEVRG